MAKRKKKKKEEVKEFSYGAELRGIILILIGIEIFVKGIFF